MYANYICGRPRDKGFNGYCHKSYSQVNCNIFEVGTSKNYFSRKTHPKLASAVSARIILFLPTWNVPTFSGFLDMRIVSIGLLSVLV